MAVFGYWIHSSYVRARLEAFPRFFNRLSSIRNGHPESAPPPAYGFHPAMLASDELAIL